MTEVVEVTDSREIARINLVLAGLKRPSNLVILGSCDKCNRTLCLNDQCNDSDCKAENF